MVLFYMSGLTTTLQYRGVSALWKVCEDKTVRARLWMPCVSETFAALTRNRIHDVNH